MKAIAVHPGKPNSIHLREIGRRVRRRTSRRRLPRHRPRKLRPGRRGRPERPPHRPAGHLRRRLRAPPRLVHLRQDRAPGLHHRRRLLRARDQPPAWVPDRVLRRGTPVRLPAPHEPRRGRRAARADDRRREGRQPRLRDPAAPEGLGAEERVHSRLGHRRPAGRPCRAAAWAGADRLLAAAEALS